MPGFSTLALGGTIVSPLRLNYDLSISANTTVTLAYSNASITDIVGLQVVIYNSGSSAITLTAGTQFNNYTSYPNYCAVINQIVIPAGQTITLITTVVGQDYTIESISGKVSVDGGAAGNLIYQTAPNRTGFLAAGTANYILESNGLNLPPKWSLLQTGSLSGGVAGSLVYQSAPNTTAKSATGTAFTSAGGGIAAMVSSTAPGWTNFGTLNGIVLTYSTGSATLGGARGYTIKTSDIGGSSGNFYTYLTNAGIPLYDGTTYTVYNDTASNYVLTVQNIQNPNSWSNALITSFAGGANQITLYPYETITFSQYNSTYLTILSATQSLGLTGVYTIANPGGAATGSWNPAIGTVVNDPQGWNSATNVNYNPRIPGVYRFTIYINQANAMSTVPVITVYKNATSGLAFLQTLGTKVGNNTLNGTFFATFETYMNGTDYIRFLANYIGNANWLNGLVTVALVN